VPTKRVPLPKLDVRVEASNESVGMRGNLLFDLDGTLTDPREGIVGCLRHALRHVGVTLPSDDELASLIGPPLHESLSNLLGSDRAHLVPRALEAYRERFASVGMFENTVYPGIPEGLVTLRNRGWRLWVVTSKPSIFAEPILSHFDLKHHFARVYGAELSGERSNKRELIAHVLRTEGLTARETIMIGDRSHDVVGAKSNGRRALGALWGYGTRVELEDVGADGLYETVAALVAGLTSGTRAPSAR
jgi:phosphoglycolate phosphatase